MGSSGQFSRVLWLSLKAHVYNSSRSIRCHISLSKYDPYRKSHTRCEPGPENPESATLVCAQIAGMPVRHLYAEDKVIYIILEF